MSAATLTSTIGGPGGDGQSDVTERSGLRRDIQALRAIAVSLVVVYHFWPSRLTGGFVGVDVFFVLSGFLITSHLLNVPPRSLRHLGNFWARRIRRLLPASFLVLGVSLVATVAVAPRTMWESVAHQTAAAALYVENWFLAGQAVNYLAEDSAATPVQHFWTLSIEEQFYLVWPILVLGAWSVAPILRLGRRHAVGAFAGVLVVVSFIVSVRVTASDPAAAYFVSWTRSWELALGGVAACIYPALQRTLGERRVLRSLVAYLGLSLILVSAVAYSAQTAFPGYAAAVPTIGTVLVIGADVKRGFLSPLRVMAARPVQIGGDISYSIYLWHWPVVVLVPLAFGRELSWAEKLIAIGLVVILSWLTKRHVEDRYRGAVPLGVPMRRSFIFALAGMIVIAAGASVVLRVNTANERRAAGEVSAAETGFTTCFASRALVHTEQCAPHGETLITEPIFAAGDQPDPYEDHCWVLGNFADQKTCHYGSTDPEALKVALVGNSHAGHWLPALQEIAAEHHWSITTYLISECYTVDVMIEFETEERSQNCLDWNHRVIDEISSSSADLVVFSNRVSRLMPGLTLGETFDSAESAFGRVLDTWTTSGVPVLVLRDTPYAVELDNVPDCVDLHRDELSKCDGTRDREQVDPLAEAAATRTDAPVALLDLTDRICHSDVCYSVVGGVIVYFDRGHLTATFAESLAPDIWGAATRLLDGA